MQKKLPHPGVDRQIGRELFRSVIFSVIFFITEVISAQSPTVCPINAGPDQSVCAPNCATLTGTFVPTKTTNTYLTSTIPYAPDPFNVGTAVTLWDDQWSGVIPIPFTFCFYGQPYNSCLIGSNGMISFSLVGAGGYCQWPIGAAVPSTADPMNTVMGPWLDLNPAVGGQVRYATYGTAPCRRFVVSWYQVPMYSCGTPCTQQIVLYETTNIIDNFIQTKPSCSWNGNYAIQAVHNATGTAATSVAGRNWPTGWTAANDAKRWTPNGTSTVTTGWYIGATLVGTGPTFTACPPNTTTYTFQATYTNCNNTTVTVSDQVIVNVSTLTLAQTQTNILCNNACNGTAGVTVTSGTGPFTYAWLPAGGTGATATGLCAGTYSCTVTGAGGCTGQATFNITQPAAITATQSQTNVLCNGNCTGAASVVASGGTPPYSYAWAPSGGNAATTTGRCAGTYTCTLTDANGCTTTSTFNITQPPALALTGTQTNVLCNSALTGSASVNASGGAAPYSYLWSPSGGTGSTATSLGAGTYTVTVTDANGCTATNTYTITQPTALTSTQSQLNVLCNAACNGSASVVASGGTAPYTYAWSPVGGAGSTATALCAGTYTCTTTDANGCTTTNTFTITQPTAITTTGTQTNVLCNAGNTGSASVIASGGTGAYTYAWAPSGGTGSTATGLIAGSYTVTVTDANGCTATQSFTITQPPALTTTATQTNVTCNGALTGSASVISAGGNGPYTYAWTPSGGSAPTASGLGAGTYVVTVTDANGCTTSRTFTITQPTALAATTSFTQSTCGNPNGSAAVLVTGGVGPYSYSWTPSGGTGATATGLTSGIYTVIYTDANGCTGSATVNVPNAAAPTSSITAITNVSCFAGSNGSATVTAAGGTIPYTYYWSPSGGTGATASNLIAGSYVVTVTDLNGCTSTSSVVITQPPVLTSSASSSPVLCFGGSTGSANVTPTGGTTPYSYAWAPSGGNGSSATGLSAGTYTVMVTDANGCTSSATTVITQPTALSATATSSPVICFGGATGSATVSANGGVGPYVYSWSPSGGSSASATGLNAGAYTATVTDANGCTATASTTVTQPTALTATTSFTQATCGSSNGSANVIVSGGTPTYSYNWLPTGGTGSAANGLPAGTYTVTYTDANGCSGTSSVVVSSTNPPSITIVASDSVSCFGGSDGFAAATTTGGTSPYTYLWTNGDADTLAGNLTAGSYSVTITDAFGCTGTTSITIGEPQLLTATASSTNVLCFGGATGTATAIGNGGTGSFTYSWSPSGGTTSAIMGLTAATYSVVITDINGCTAYATTTITEPPVLTTTATSTPVSCFAGTNGTATGSTTGGSGAYSYLWQPSNGTGATETGLTAGLYTITVTDANGCTTSATTTITEPTALIAAISSTQATCSFANGSATVNVSGGITNYTYLWSPSGGTAATTTGITGGNYTCLITDANGCTISPTVNVASANAPIISTVTNMVTCFGGNDGSATAITVGGTGPYSYLWNNGDADSIAAGVTAGSYTVTLTDANGCIATSTVTVNEPSMLNLQASANPTMVCEGSSVQLNATANGGTPAYSFAWLPIALPGQTQTITPSTTATYTVVATDANGCTANSSVTVTVNAMPTALLTADVFSGCAPLCVDFTDLSSISSGTITSWNWDFGDQSSSTMQNPTHCYNTPGINTVVLTVTSVAGCTETITMSNYIDVYPIPVAAFTANPQPTTILSPTITFTDASTYAATWSWSFGDVAQSSSTLQDPSFTYPEADCYTAILEVTSIHGCTDTASQPICIIPDASMYVPNTFTPDDNGLNDVFLPSYYGIDESSFEMWIFDRWGNLIFQTDDPNEGWDGRVQGSSTICQQDTYVWKIKYADLLNKKYNLIGHVNLIK